MYLPPKPWWKNTIKTAIHSYIALSHLHCIFLFLILRFSKQVLKVHINILTLQTKVNKAQRSPSLPNTAQLLNDRAGAPTQI